VSRFVNKRSLANIPRTQSQALSLSADPGWTVDVPVVAIALHQLVVAEHAPGCRVDRNHRIRIEIVARPQLAGEVGRRIARGHVQHAVGFIEGERWVIFDRSTMSARCPLFIRYLPNCCITATEVQGQQRNRKVVDPAVLIPGILPKIRPRNCPNQSYVALHHRQRPRARRRWLRVR
jgi:hypothetical protein